MHWTRSKHIKNAERITVYIFAERCRQLFYSVIRGVKLGGFHFWTIQSGTDSQKVAPPPSPDGRSLQYIKIYICQPQFPLRQTVNCRKRALELDGRMTTATFTFLQEEKKSLTLPVANSPSPSSNASASSSSPPTSASTFQRQKLNSCQTHLRLRSPSADPGEHCSVTLRFEGTSTIASRVDEQRQRNLRGQNLHGIEIRQQPSPSYSLTVYKGQLYPGGECTEWSWMAKTFERKLKCLNCQFAII